MSRVDLIIVLSFAIGKDDAQSYLVALINHGPCAGRHFASAQVNVSRNGLEELFDSLKQLFGGLREFWLRPKNNNVRKHVRDNRRHGVLVKNKRALDGLGSPQFLARQQKRVCRLLVE